jgi:2-polyprenyl-6-methoxyphenol hydroxylase-like FAD-dependent oxidoreductase
MSSSVDVLIIGGGPAGLSTALSLCRARHTAVVFDSGTYRNDLLPHARLFHLGSRDPKKYREAARAELVGRYRTVQLVDLAVTTVVRTEKELLSRWMHREGMDG